MTALTTFDGVAEGTDLAIIQGGAKSRWRMGPQGQLLDKDGEPLPRWFFTGLLERGDIHLANFAPPEVGEWFGMGSRFYLVLTQENNEGVVEVAVFRYGDFIYIEKQHHIVDSFTRAAPEWLVPQVNRLLLQMATRIKDQLRENDAYRRNRDEVRRLASELRTAKSYLDSAVTRSDRMRGET